MWKPGDVISWRGIYRERIWHSQTVIVVRDGSDEIVLTLLPGAECIAPEGYLQGKIVKNAAGISRKSIGRWKDTSGVQIVYYS